LIILSAYQLGNAEQTDVETKRELFNREREYSSSNYFLHFNRITSATHLWEGPIWSEMELTINQYNNPFKTPYMFRNGNSIEFSTESVQKIDSLGYAFYGKFSYKTNRDFDSDYNQFYKMPDYGNPIFLFVPVKGNWETQEYYFKGGISKEIVKRRLYVGASMSYNGNLFNRIIDTRNRQTDLSIHLSPSITYNLSNKNSLSLAFNYNRAKYEPLNSHYSQRPGDDSNYWLYLNKGLGTYERLNTGYGFYSIINNFDISTQWHKKYRQNNLFTATFSFENGSNIFQSKVNIPETNDFFKLGKYDWQNIGGQISISNKLFSKRALSSLSFKNIKGKAFTYNIQQSQYQNSYKYTGRSLSAMSKIFVDRSILNFCSLAFHINYVNAIDMNYGHRYSYTNIIPVLLANLFSVNFLKGEISSQITASGNYNYSFIHQPLSAISNIYTTGIAYPSLSYYTSNYFVLNPSIFWEKIVNNRVLFGLELGASVLKPLSINYINSYTTIGTDDMNKSLYLTLRVVF
jgi:hypothetical protein